MRLQRVRKDVARKAFKKGQKIIVSTVDATGIVMNDLTIGYDALMAYGTDDFDEIISKYAGYSYCNPCTRIREWVKGRQRYYIAE